MSHPFALLARRRQERLGEPPLKLTTLPSPSIDFSKLLPSGASSLAPILKELKDAQNDSANLSIPGFTPEDARGMILKAVASGGVDPKEFLGKFFGTGAAVVCTAAGAPALAPLCAKGGQVIGEVVAGLQVKPSGPTNTAASDALNAMIQADSAMLKATKDSVLFNLAARFNSEPKAMEEARKVVDEFYPDLSKLVPFPEYICLSSNKGPNGTCPDAAFGPYFGGFFIPFYVTNACPIIGTAYSQACRPDLYPLWEWHMDYSAPVIGKQDYPLQSGWVEKLMVSVMAALKKRGIDISAAFQVLFDDNEAKLKSGQSRWWAPGLSNAEVMMRAYQDLRAVVWPALEIALQRRLSSVVVEAAVRANVRLIKGVDDLTTELARRQGCSGGDCKKTLQAHAAEIAKNLETEDVQMVQQKVEAAFPDTSPASSPSPLRPVIAVGAAAGLVYALHRFIKRYLLCLIPSSPSLATRTATPSTRPSSPPPPATSPSGSTMRERGQSALARAGLSSGRSWGSSLASGAPGRSTTRRRWS